MFLHDLASSARAECIAFARQVRACHRLGDGGESRRNDVHPFETAIDRSAWRSDCDGGGRAVHREHAQHIANPIYHRDGRRRAACLRFSDGAGDYILNIRGGEERAGARARTVAIRRRVGRDIGRRPRAATAPATRDEQAHRNRDYPRPSHPCSQTPRNLCHPYVATLDADASPEHKQLLDDHVQTVIAPRSDRAVPTCLYRSIFGRARRGRTQTLGLAKRGRSVDRHAAL